MIYLYVTPSGIVNLIEGEKMPVKPERDRNLGQATEYYFKIAWEKYKANLEAVKASSVPVDDQERGKKIIKDHAYVYDVAHIQPDTFYGPFDIGYKKGFKCKQEGRPTCTSSANCTCYIADGLAEVAILTPSNSGELKHDLFQTIPACNWEEVGKLEEKEEQDDMLREILSNYRDLQHYRKHEGSTESDDSFIKTELERFIITRKQPL